jgi:hypothetical protein
MQKQIIIEPIYAKVADGIWVGNLTSACQTGFLSGADITAIINLSGKMSQYADDIDYFDYALPSSELMNTEFPKTITKLEAIMSDIKDLRANGRNILIHCYDGKNKCMLAAGYYLVTQCGNDPNTVIDQLEQLYFTPEQRKEEQESRLSFTTPDDPSEGVAVRVDLDVQERRDQRNAVRCLTLASFKRILRLNQRK